MRTVDEYKARNAARQARQAKQTHPPKKEPWWFNQPLAIDRFTGWLMIYTLVLAVATIGSAAILWKTDHTLNDTLIATDRPWLTASASIFGDLIVESEASIRLKIEMKNTGHSPAADVAAYPAMVMFLPYPMTILELQEDQCRHAGVYGLAPNQGVGYTVFPGDTQISVGTARLDRAEIERRRDSLKPEKSFFDPSIIACLNYRFTFTAERHRTAAIFRLGQKIPSDQNRVGLINPDEAPISAARLGLEYVGSYAD